jgi:hypothetical protein
VLQVEEEAQRVRAAAGKPTGAWRSGRWRRNMEGRGEGQCGSGERRAQRWRARGMEKSGAGQLGLEKVAGEGGGVMGARQSRRDWR